MAGHIRMWHTLALVAAVPVLLLLGTVSAFFYLCAVVALIGAVGILLVVQKREDLRWLDDRDRPQDFHGHYGPLQ